MSRMDRWPHIYKDSNGDLGRHPNVDFPILKYGFSNIFEHIQTIFGHSGGVHDINPMENPWEDP